MGGIKPDGWHVLSQMPSHTLRDGLYINGFLRATVEALSDDGPWYGSAIAPDHEQHRLCAGVSHTAAAEWCERMTGYRPVGTPAPADREGGR